MDITQTAFCDPQQRTEIATNLYEFQHEHKSHSWGPTLRGINFSLLKVLELDIVPLNVTGYWYSLQNALTLFCDQRLARSPALKTFKLKLVDKLENHVDPLIFGPNYRLHTVYAPILARFEDDEATLRIFKKVVQKAKSCEMSLPYWMQTHVKTGRLIKEWSAYVGAQMYFMPLSTTSKAFNFHYIDQIRVPSWILSDLQGIQMGILKLWRKDFHPAADHDWDNVTRKDSVLLADLA